MRTYFFKKSLALILALAMTVGMLPIVTVRASASQPAREIVFIDERVEDFESLSKKAPEDSVVLIISGESDGFEQMRAALSHEKNLSAVHIISHGAQGKLYLGNSVLSLDTIARYRMQLEALGNSLGKNGDLLIYGCETAKGVNGLELIQEIAEITGANVAGSDDMTSGNPEKGDSILEVSTEYISTPAIDLDGWGGILPNVSKTVDLGQEVTLYANDLGYQDYNYIHFVSMPGSGSELGIGSASNHIGATYSYSKTDYIDTGYIKFKATTPGTYSFQVRWTSNTNLVGSGPIAPYTDVFTITITVPNPAPTDIVLSNSNAPAGYEGLRIGRLTGLDNSDDTNTFTLVTDSSDLFAVSTENAAARHGVLSFQPGKTLAAGVSAEVTIRATDGAGSTKTQTFTITGAVPITIDVEPSGTCDITYDGNGGDFWDDSGYMPPENGKGTLQYKNGASYSDLPTAINDNWGLYGGEVLGYTATSSEGQDSFAIGTEYFLVTIADSIGFTATALEDATYNTAYSKIIDPAAGGSGTYTYSVTAGSLPAGLSFDGPARTISGAPTAAPNTYTFTITAVDASDGSKTKAAIFSLTVVKATPTVSTWPAVSALTYGQTFADALGNDGAASVPGSFSIVDASIVPGVTGSPYTKTVTFTPSDTTSYSTVTTTVSVTVTKAGAVLSDISCPSKTYDGAALSPSASVITGVGSIAYTYSGTGIIGSTATAPSDAGTYTVTATLAASANFNAAVKTADVTIAKADQSDFAITGKPAAPTYGDVFTLSTSGGSGAGAVIWNASGGASVTAGGQVTVAGMDQVTVTATKAADGNYNEATDIYLFTPARATPNLGTVSATSLYVGESLLVSALSRTDTSVAGSLSWDANPAFSSAAGGSVPASYTFTPTDTTLYNTVSAQTSVTVNTKVITGVSPQTAISDKEYGTSQSALGLPASVEVTAAGRSGSETKTVPVIWSGYLSNTLAPQSLTGTLDLTGNTELNNSGALTASIAVTLQPITAKHIDDVSAMIKVGSTNGTELLKALVTGQFDPSVDTTATNAAGWTGFPADYNTVTTSTQTIAIPVIYVAGSTETTQNVTISYDIVNPEILAYASPTITSIAATDASNADAAALLSYVNSFRSLTATWPAEAVGASAAADSAPEYGSLSSAYAAAGTTYTFSQTYLGHSLSQSVTVNPVKMDAPSLTINYIAETVNTTASIEYRIGTTGGWTPCSADMSVVPWLGQTVSYQTPSDDAHKIDSDPVDLAFPARESAPTTLSAVINDTNTEVTVSGLTTGTAYEYSLDGAVYQSLSMSGKIAAAAYQSSIHVRKACVADTSFHSPAAIVPVNYTMIFSTAEGSSVAARYAVSGGSVNAPAAPTRSGHAFAGWFSTSTCAAGSEAAFPYTMAGNITVYAKWMPVSDDSGSGSQPTTQAGSSNALVEVNGQAQSAGTSQTTTNESGQTVTTVTVDTGKLQSALTSQGAGATVTIPVTGGASVASGVLTGSMVNTMETNGAILEIRTDSATYSLPAAQINISAVSQQLGEHVSLSDITVQVSIAEPPSQTIQVVESAADAGNYEIVVPPVSFTISCTYGGATVDVSQFNSYVERTIAIPDGVDPAKITTAVVVEPDGTSRHVPTRVTEIDGRYYAVINSLTNSTYTVVWHPVEFADAAGNWARDAINDMGSRMVITGYQDGTFRPDAGISRAEFASILVRALGLKLESGSPSFPDVPASDWCYEYVETAAAYGLINGCADGAFHPEAVITREQVLVILARAMALTGLQPMLTGSEISQLLSAYTDAADASVYAEPGIAACVRAGLVSGKTGATLNPGDNITRAEVAVLVQRLLQKSGLI